MADESPRLLPPGAPPGAVALDVEPTPEELERMRWARMARFGRHGWAARGTGVVGLFGGILMSAASVIEPSWLGATRGDGFAWMLVLGVPVLAGAYRVLLAQWDQEAARNGGGRVSLDTWRGDGERGDGERGDAPRPSHRDA